MPGGDHRGPLGQGPRTGRAAGYCAGYDTPGYANAGPGGGYRRGGRGRGTGWGGGGRGWRHRYDLTGLPGWQRSEGSLGRVPEPPDPATEAASPPTPAQELAALRVDLRCLEESAARLRRRIDELDTAPAETTAD